MNKKLLTRLIIIAFILIPLIMLSKISAEAGWFPMISCTTKDLRGVWGSSGCNVFAVGKNGNIIIGQYNGLFWYFGNIFPEWNTHPIYAYPTGIWGLSDEDVYLMGYEYNKGTGGNEGFIYKYVNGAWDRIYCYGTWEGNNCTIYDAWGSDSENIYFVSGEGIIVHYENSMFSQLITDTLKNLYSIWGNSKDDIFVVGEGGTIIHYDSSTWSTMISGTKENLKGVWGSSGSNVFAVGDSGTILQYDGTSWSEMDSGTSNSLFGVWGNSATDVFAVGDGGTILHYNGPSCLLGKLYSEYSKKTELLRNFRDNVLSQTPVGQEIIRLYYQWSPVIVKAMEEDEELKKKVKEMIEGVLGLMEKGAE